MDDKLKIALEAVQAASDICSTIQKQLVSEDSITKKDRSPVTIADYASQAIICRTLKENFQQFSIVGEEDANSLRQAENKAVLDKIASFLPDWSADEILHSIEFGNGQAGGTFWTLDPIDGTKGFLRGDQYAVALALIENGEPVMGLLGCPNLPFSENDDDGTLMYAIKGKGCFARSMHGTEVREAKVTGNAEGDIVRFLESVESGHANHGLQGQVISHFGDKAQAVRYDSQVKYAVLSQGIAEVYLRLPNEAKPDYQEKIWDHAAGVAIVQEAGGTVTDMHGKALDFGQGKKLVNNRGVIVSNGPLHKIIIDTIN